MLRRRIDLAVVLVDRLGGHALAVSMAARTRRAGWEDGSGQDVTPVARRVPRVAEYAREISVLLGNPIVDGS
jgi:hypothetical protein